MANLVLGETKQALGLGIVRDDPRR